MLCFLDHAAILLLIKQCPEFRSTSSRYFIRHLAALDQLLHGRKFQFCPVILGLQILTSDIYDQDDLLTEMVKCDDLVKQHQIHILKPFLVFCIQHQRRLCIFHVIVGKISYQSTGKCRKIFNLRTFIFIKYLSDILTWMLCLHIHGCSVFDREFSVCTGDLKPRVISQKCVAPPFLIILR